MKDPELLRIWWREYGKSIAWLLCLQEYSIDFRLAGLDHGVMGTANVLPEYHKATITVDPNKIDSKAEFFQTIRHEFFHIFFARIEHVQSASLILADSDKTRALLKENFRVFVESQIASLELIFDSSLSLHPVAFANRAKLSRAAWSLRGKKARPRKTPKRK